MRARRGFLAQAGFLLAAALGAHDVDAADVRSAGAGVIGWVEPVQVEDKLVLNAKIDTGADIPSLDAQDVKITRRGRKEWVSFWTKGRDKERVDFEREIYRYVDIERAGGQNEKRPAVILSLCLGDVRREVVVNLVDRSQLEYPMIIGRSFLQNKFIVDPTHTYTTVPSCAPTKEKETQ
ncbi:MAG TPA: RimK/LysX family protein [Burkholderiales bacterium]|nr:RimK/LysX family protein [Burkholderiales bacterium]